MAPESKAIIISGAAVGVGRALARNFLQNGHRVFLLDVNEEELEHTTAVHLKQYISRFSSAVCDLKDVHAIRRSVRQAAEFFGGYVDVLINNGGISSPQWPDDMTMADEATFDIWKAYIDTNLTAPFAVSQACIPYMKTTEEETMRTSQGPSITHIGSFRAHQSDRNQEGYAASKAGVLGLMHSMAVSCEKWGIRVNTVSPGRIKVAHESKQGDEEGQNFSNQVGDKDVAQHPVNRAGTPEDIVEAVNYLIDAGFVTGQDITVDGGALIKKGK